MEKFLQNPKFWFYTVGVIVILSLAKWLWEFNKIILMIVVALGGALGVLYSNPVWLQKLWGSFN
ncbi:MAG: hypothetical protein SFY80_02880 [Verrucomicrobiota bacterium]|nr:hypothetical protein [Verrucomicrobiota bacterium]